MSTTEKHQFQAEIAQLLDIVIHSLYTDKEIFVRELISNAADALEKLKYLQTSGTEVLDPETALGITIVTDETAKTIAFTDTGIGMTAASWSKTSAPSPIRGRARFWNSSRPIKAMRT